MKDSFATIEQAHHQQIQLLLPWYVNKTLHEQEYAHVHQHVRYCLVCRRELVHLQKIAANVQTESDMSLSANAAFARLAKQLPSRQTDDGITQALPPLLRKNTERTNQSHLRYSYAIAATIVLIALPVVTFTLFSQEKLNDYYTLSSATTDYNAVTGSLLNVVFAKSSSQAEINNIVAELHGRIEGEANSVGALTIRLTPAADSPSPEQAIALLRKRPDVLLVEPIL